MKAIILFIFVSITAYALTVNRIDELQVRESGTTTTKLTLSADATNVEAIVANGLLIDAQNGDITLATDNLIVDEKNGSGFGVLTSPRNATGGALNTQGFVVETGRNTGAGSYGNTGQLILRAGQIRDGAGSDSISSTTGAILVESGEIRSSALANTLGNTGNATFRSASNLKIGNTGTTFVSSGNASNGNSGNIDIFPGTASGSRGQVRIGGSLIDVDVELSSDPTGTNIGQVYYNTTDNKFRFYNGSTWEYFGEANTDESVKVSVNDTTPGYLNGKLVAGTNISLVENNDGANETLTINATAGGGLSIGDSIGNSPTAFGLLYADGAGNLGNDDSYTFSGTSPNVLLNVGASSFGDANATLEIESTTISNLTLKCNGVSCENQIILDDETTTTNNLISGQNGSMSFISGGSLFLEPSLGVGTGDVILTGDLRVNNQSGSAAFIELDNSTAVDYNIGASAITGDFFIEESGGDVFLSYEDSANLLYLTPDSNLILEPGGSQVQLNVANPLFLMARTAGQAYYLNVDSNQDFLLRSVTDAINFLVYDTSADDLVLAATDDIVLRPEGATVAIEDETPTILFNRDAGEDYLIQADANSDFIIRSATDAINFMFYDASANNVNLVAPIEVRFQANGFITHKVVNNSTNSTITEISADNTHAGADFRNPTGAANSSTGLINLQFTGDSDCTGAAFARFRDLDGIIGSIGCASATTVSFNTTSDARLKTEIGKIDDALDRVLKMSPKKYTWNESGASDEGFFAQELKQLAPNAVTGNELDDPELNPMSVDYGKLTPLLTAAIQKQHELIEELEERIAVLEGKTPKPKKDKRKIIFKDKKIKVESSLLDCESARDCEEKTSQLDLVCPENQFKRLRKNLLGSITGVDCVREAN